MTILITNFCKIITNYDSELLQITGTLLKITTKIYYKLRQVLLHITAVFSVITNYGKFYYKLWLVLQIAMLLQITS